jgi:hypothetical protein
MCPRRIPPRTTDRAQSMSTATPASIPPRRTASMKAGLRPICFVIAKTSSPSRAASAAIRRAFPSTASRSMT